MSLIPITLREWERLNDWMLREYNNFLRALNEAYKKWNEVKVEAMLKHLDKII